MSTVSCPTPQVCGVVASHETGSSEHQACVARNDPNKPVQVVCTGAITAAQTAVPARPGPRRSMVLPEKEAKILTGYQAIEIADMFEDVTLNKHADPTEGPRTGLTVNEAREVATEDPSLIWFDANGLADEASLHGDDDTVARIVAYADGREPGYANVDVWNDHQMAWEDGGFETHLNLTGQTAEQVLVMMNVNDNGELRGLHRVRIMDEDGNQIGEESEFEFNDPDDDYESDQLTTELASLTGTWAIRLDDDEIVWPGDIHPNQAHNYAYIETTELGDDEDSQLNIQRSLEEAHQNRIEHLRGNDY